MVRIIYYAAATAILAVSFSCSQWRQAPRTASADDLVRALGGQRTDLVVELGSGVAIRTPEVNAVLSRGGTAIPALRAALRSENPVLVGYAAFCLEQLGAQEGKEEAQAALGRFEASTSTFDTDFAVGALKSYLQALKR